MFYIWDTEYMVCCPVYCGVENIYPWEHVLNQSVKVLPSRRFHHKINLKGLLYFVLLYYIIILWSKLLYKRIFGIVFYILSVFIVALVFKRNFWEASILSKSF